MSHSGSHKYDSVVELESERIPKLRFAVERMSFARTSGFTAAKSFGVGYLANNPGVTSLTRLSVHCAERIVATSSSQGL